MKNRIFKRRASLDARKARSGYLFVLPFLLGIVLIYVPILLDSIWFSFNQLGTEIVDGLPVQVLTPVGIHYYDNALRADPLFPSKLLEGIQQLLFEVPAVIIFSLFIAVVLNQKMLGRAAFRAIFFLPVIVSTGIMEAINANDVMSNASQEGINDGSGAANAGGISKNLPQGNL